VKGLGYRNLEKWVTKLWCGHREHHHLPRVDKKFTNWESWDNVKKDEVLNYIKLHENEIQNTQTN